MWGLLYDNVRYLLFTPPATDVTELLHLQMKPYFNAYSALLKDQLPHLYDHFHKLSFNPEFYLIEWLVFCFSIFLSVNVWFVFVHVLLYSSFGRIFTIYTRVLPLDVACRVWDMFCRDGDIFLYRTALGMSPVNAVI